MGYTGLVIPGISCYVIGLVVPGFRYTCMSLYIGDVILEDFTANTANETK